MELRDFVRQALEEIVLAVRQSQEFVSSINDGASISPRVLGGSNFTLHCRDDDGGGVAFPVEFDLSVTVSDSQDDKVEAKGKLSIISIATAKGGIESSISEKTVAIQRLKFAVPIRYPKGQFVVDKDNLTKGFRHRSYS